MESKSKCYPTVVQTGGKAVTLMNDSNLIELIQSCCGDDIALLLRNRLDEAIPIKNPNLDDIYDAIDNIDIELENLRRALPDEA